MKNVKILLISIILLVVVIGGAFAIYSLMTKEYSTGQKYSVKNMRLNSSVNPYTENPMPGQLNIFDGYNEGKGKHPEDE